jgi:membrane fusion protein (multidrug efflux system)
MAKRMVLMLAVTLAAVGGLGFIKFRQVQEAMAQNAAFTPPPEAVTTIVAKSESWPATLNVIGTAAAVQGVTVSADLPGIVSRIAFESGASVEEGEILVQLDTKQERAQLAAVEATRDLARLNFERMSSLVDEGAITRAEYDRAAAEQKETAAKVEEIRAILERKTIRAPFTGILGLRQVNLGQYLSPGDAVVSLQSLDPIYVNFGVPQQDSVKVVIGRDVRVAIEDAAAAAFTGRVTAINAVVDEATRNVQVQATLSNPQNRLRPGMFVQTEVLLGAAGGAVTLPASAISYAPYGDSVFVVTDLKDTQGKAYRGVRQQFVKLGPSRGDQIAILSGVKSGEEVVTSGVFKLRNGAAISIDNKVQPSNKRAPNPEES